MYLHFVATVSINLAGILRRPAGGLVTTPNCKICVEARSWSNVKLAYCSYGQISDTVRKTRAECPAKRPDS